MRAKLKEERDAQNKRMNEAATKIQAITKGRQQRQRYLEQLHARKVAEANEKERAELEAKADAARVKKELQAKARAQLVAEQKKTEEAKRAKAEEATKEAAKRRQAAQAAREKEAFEQDMRQMEESGQRKAAQMKRKEEERRRQEAERMALEAEKRRLRQEHEEARAEEMTEVLVKKEVRGYVVKREQQRIQSVRQAVAAAKVIQRWYRYKKARSSRNVLEITPRRQHLSPSPAARRPQAAPFPPGGAAVPHRSPNPGRGRQPRVPSQVAGRRAVEMTGPQLGPHERALEQRRQLVAALTIQLWWRRLLASKHSRRQRRSVAKRTGGPHLKKQGHHVKTIYGARISPFLSHAACSAPVTSRDQRWALADGARDRRLSAGCRLLTLRYLPRPTGAPQSITSYKPQLRSHKSHLAYQGPPAVSLSLASAEQSYSQPLPRPPRNQRNGGGPRREALPAVRSLPRKPANPPRQQPTQRTVRLPPIA